MYALEKPEALQMFAR